MNKYFPLLAFALISSCSEPKPNNVNQPYFTTWEHYLGDPGRTHFSNLDQIDTLNVSELKLAWSYKSGGLQEGRTTQIQTSPLVVENVLYGVNAAIELFAVNAKTGEEIWKFSPNTKDESGLGLNRLPKPSRRSILPLFPKVEMGSPDSMLMAYNFGPDEKKMRLGSFPSDFQ